MQELRATFSKARLYGHSSSNPTGMFRQELSKRRIHGLGILKRVINIGVNEHEVRPFSVSFHIFTAYLVFKGRKIVFGSQFVVKIVLLHDTYARPESSVGHL